MESEKYREFLKRQAVKRPIQRNASTEKIILKIPGQNRIDETSGGGTSDILDTILLGKEMGENITVDRRAASLLRFRLNVLEEENLQMQRKIRSLTIINAILAVAVLLLFLYILLNLV
jgi:hypothetical protein